jgi:choice-of-anchor B domain-containing protein
MQSPTLRPVPFVFLLLLILPGPGHSAENVAVLSHHDRGEGYSGVWGYTAPNGTELVFSGTQTGTSILDATDPENAVEIAFIPGPNSGWREMATFGPYCYIVTETEGAAIQVVSLVNPLAPTLVRTLNPPDVPHTTAHEIKADPQTGYLYVAGTRNANEQTGLLIFDLNVNPLNPPLRGTWTTYYAHDLSLLNGRAYVACIGDDLIVVLDVSQPGTPPQLTQWTYPAPIAPHNTWPTPDGNFLVTTDETTNGSLRMWDISNLALPVQTDTWPSPNNAVVHNAYIRGNYCFMSHYSDGLRVVDITDPYNLVGVGWYDTGNAWGCWCYAADPTIAYISDIQNGTFVLRFTPPSTSVGGSAATPPLALDPLVAAPNPFRASVTVDLNVDPRAAEGLRLAVYDVSGRLVRLLADGALPAAGPTIRWDGRNSAGVPVASGVYTLRLDGPGEVRASRRLVRLP